MDTEKQNASPFTLLLKQFPFLQAEAAIEILSDSEALYEKLIRQMLRQTPLHIEQMDGFLEADDIAAFAVKAHGLKSSLAQAGARELESRAIALERAAKAGDAQYCREHYGAFRVELLSVIEQLNAALRIAYPNAGDATVGTLAEHIEVLVQAKAAADDFDSLSAAELLQPLTHIRFDPVTDALVAQAVEALEAFQPQQALTCIDALLNRCGQTE